MNKSLLACVLSGALVLPTVAHADAPMELVIVTPTRFESPPDLSSIDVTVITADDIARSAATTLPALLAQHAGIHVRNTDGTPDMAIDMRGFGMTGNQNTLVMLDGQPLNDIELTSVRWSAIPLASIERIEIVNGGGSVLFGGGATGGAINIITRRHGNDGRVSLGLGVGSFDTKQWQFSYSGETNTADLRITASGLDTSNYRINNNNDQKNLEADLRFGDNDPEVSVKFGASEQSLRYPGPRTVDPSIGVDQVATDPRGTSTPLDYGRRDGVHINIGMNRELTTGKIAGELSLRKKNQQAYSETWATYLDTALSVLAFTPRTQIPYKLGDTDNELIVGVDLADWNYDSRRSDRPTSIDVPAAHVIAKQFDRGFYAQNNSRLDTGTTLAFGARAQHVSYQARDTVNPETYATGDQSRNIFAYDMSLRQILSDSVSVFGRIGRSFRIATVDEIYDQYGGPIFDSRISLLEPQTSQDMELGADYSSAATSARAAIYGMNLRNEIYYNALTYSNMNLAPTRRYGMELEANRKLLSGLELSGAYSYAIAKFREGVYGGVDVAGNSIPLVPRHILSLSSTWNISDSDTLSATASHTGEQYFDNDQANTFSAKLPAYTTVDLKFSRRSKSWQLTAVANNIFDRRYVTYGVASTFTPGKYNAYPMPDRNFSLNITHDF
jgi:iron complex outermembrane receptor protein